MAVKKIKRVKVELKPTDFPLPKKQMASCFTSSRKGKEVVALDNLVDMMGCRTEEVVLAYRNNHSTRLVPFPIVEKVLERGKGLSGDVTYEEGDEASGGELVCILDVDNEVEVQPIESTEHGCYEHSGDEDD
ncbi:hypothetical protein Syun_017575 [Stephania yunnanensis]|uniref:Uncharacterized protein n=1 Tax=Stephania yunnanensis TaxID=152371 RepID=A0AAP0J9G2_9MAGN